MMNTTLGFSWATARVGRSRHDRETRSRPFMGAEPRGGETPFGRFYTNGIASRALGQRRGAVQSEPVT